ncbi:MAG: hypothetical protein DRH30_00910 [Deltaproteobacteria bacterium]|nr:MAG: hypothetical protein DRH30_00910 [Deltaproteobacteria bacterium]
MSTPILRIALVVPGRLVWGANPAFNTYPYGGIELGFVGRVNFMPRERVQEITDPTTGRVLDAVSAGDSALLSCRIRDADDTASEAVFLNTEKGAATQRMRIDIGGDNGAGYLYSQRVNALTFVPDAVVDGNNDIHRIVHFYKAMPRQQDSFEILLRMGSKAEMPIEFQAIPNASGELATMLFPGDGLF